MAGAGFKDFNSGDVLTASDVDTYLMQQTVMVFADSSARSTALGANVAEGMLSYLEDTDAVEKYDGSSWVALGGGGLTSPLTTKGDVWGYSTTDARIPVGSDGTVLTADSAESLGVKWAAVASGGKTLLSTTTLSGGSTDITGISTAYTDLEVVVYGIDPSTDLQVRIYPNDISNISSQVGTRRYGSTPTNDIESYASTYLVMANGQAYASGNTTNGAILVIYDYANTSAPVKPFHLSNRLQTNAVGGTLGVMNVGGGINTSNAITQLKFYTSSGTFNGGTVKIYGVK